jgi:hypothetical protein
VRVRLRETPSDTNTESLAVTLPPDEESTSRCSVVQHDGEQ